jgi:hypothetical protein
MMSLTEFMAKWFPVRPPSLQMQHDDGCMAFTIIDGDVVRLSPAGLRQWAKLMTRAADQIDAQGQTTEGSIAFSREVRRVPRW